MFIAQLPTSIRHWAQPTNLGVRLDHFAIFAIERMGAVPSLMDTLIFEQDID
jgi:hypothetical protein